MLPSTAPPSLTGTATISRCDCHGHSVDGVLTCRPASAPRAVVSKSVTGLPNTLSTRWS
jgi:hypothetical protein